MSKKLEIIKRGDHFYIKRHLSWRKVEYQAMDHIWTEDIDRAKVFLDIESAIDYSEKVVAILNIK
jgi:hypothetical protein